MPHLSRQAPPRSLRLMAVALALVLISLLVNAGAPAPNVEAGKDASVSITADKQNVNAGDTVKLKIKLQNVKNATLNGEALKDGKDKVEKKVLVCATTTYTVEAMSKNGGPKISQSLTINATGTTTNKDCPSPAAVPNPLPDLVVSSMTLTQLYVPTEPDGERLRLDYAVTNRGQAPVTNAVAYVYVNGKPEFFSDTISLQPGATFNNTVASSKKDGESLTYSVVLDRDNKIVESDETNNTMAANITVVKGQNPIDTVHSIDKIDEVPSILKFIKP